ncbi:MAG: hypothetical protein JWP35_1680 [Caulobacter sp.]|nr:hypothetical protein [Caulobacter sp.]
MTDANAASLTPAFDRDRKTMMAAIILLFVSQFLPYRHASGGGYLTREMDTDHYTGHVFFNGHSAATGWQAHPYAIVLIGALAAIYLTKFHTRPWWVKWGYWASCVIIFPCISGEVIATPGGLMGLVAFGLAVLTAFNHHKMLAATKTGAAAPPPEAPPAA